MSRLIALLPLLVLLLGGCGAATEPPAETETSQDQTTTQPDSPPSTVSQAVVAENGEPDDAPEQGEDGVGANEPKSDATAGNGQSDRSTPTKAPEASANPPTASPRRVVPDDTTIVPGERLGAVTRTTTYDDLAAEYGADRLSDTEVHLGEGFMAPGTRVDLGEDYSFSVVWTDGDRTAPLEIRELGSGWQTPEGIHRGMSFNQLQQVLGEFELLGFGWDYGGTVLLDNTAIADYSGKLFIRLAPSVADWEAKKEQLFKVRGDQAFNSTDPNLDGLDIEVEELVVNLNTF